MRELVSAGPGEVACQALLPPVAALAPPPPQEQQAEAPAPAERVQQPVWYTVAVCTSEEEGAGLTPGDGSAKVFLVLHGARGSSQRLQLPAQAGDFQRGQEDVFRWGALAGPRQATLDRPAADMQQAWIPCCHALRLAGCNCPAWARWSG